MQCPLCSDFSAPTIQIILKHIGRVHANCAGFQITCGVDACEKSFKNFRRFKDHLKKVHHFQPQLDLESTHSNETNEQETVGDGDDDTDMQTNDESLINGGGLEEQSDTGEVLRDLDRLKARALWILKLKEKRNLTQSTLNEVLLDVTELCSDILCDVGIEVRKVKQ